MVKPGQPFQSGQSDGFTRRPGSAAMDQLSLVEPIDDLGRESLTHNWFGRWALNCRWSGKAA
jgi:hypothetical protein